MLSQPRLTAFFIEGDPSIQETVDQVKRELMGALSQASEVEVLPILRVIKPSEILILPVVSTTFREAYSAMEEKRFAEARGFFKKAITIALAQPERANFGQIFDAYVAWAVASIQDGDEEEARAALRALAKLAPNYVLPKDLPPVFKREFERAKHSANKLPRGSISIETPEGALVFLNGQPVGIAPVVLPNLPRGTHYISMEGDHFDIRFGQVVELRSAQAQVRGILKKTVIRLPPNYVADPALTPFLDAEALDRLEPLAENLGAAFVLVGFIKELEPGYFNLSMTLFHAQRRCFLSLAPIGFSKNLVGKSFLGKRVSDAIMQRVRLADKEKPASLPLDWRARGAIEYSSLRD